MNKITRYKYFFVLILIISLIGLSIFLFRSDIFKNGKGKDVTVSSDGKVSLVISPEYDEYFIDQDIWMKVSVVNNSNSTYYLKFPLTNLYTHFKGMYPSGKIFSDSSTAELNEIHEIHDIKDSLKLEPGSSYEKVMALNNVIEKFYKYKSDKNETGIYKITAVYQDLVSNEIDLKVSEPVGPDKELYDQVYVQLYGMDLSQQQRAQRTGELLKKYPSSKYSPQLFASYFRESNFSKDYNNNSEDINDFFKYNYDTYGADLILDLGNVNFEKLLSKYRDSKTGYMISQRKREKLTHK